MEPSMMSEFTAEAKRAGDTFLAGCGVRLRVDEHDLFADALSEGDGLPWPGV